MRIIPVLLVALIMLPMTGFALDVAGVPLEQSVAVGGQTLKLNGYGIRKKLFVKVYIGSFYATKRLTRATDVLQDGGDKLIRMNFLHSKVEKAKITDAFAEGLTNNSPEVATSPEARKFLSLFVNDFIKGDTVDITLGADGTVTARHNGKVLGVVVSKKLSQGILAIYFGEKPADESLKQGMLGSV